MSAEQARAALRGFTLRMVEGAAYEELTETLDAIAGLPGANDLRAEIAGRRMALLAVHDRDERERERVLAATVPDIASIPLAARVAWIAGAGRYRRLIAPHLRPLLPEIETAAERAPDDPVAQQTLWRARVYLGGNPPVQHRATSVEDEPLVEEDEPGWIPTWPPEVDAGLDVVRRLVIGRRSYEEIAEALDAVLELPGGEQAAGAVANQRLLMVALYHRDDAEAERVLAQVAPVLATFTLHERADAVLDLCSGRPALAERYVPPLIAEAEEALRAHPDQPELDGIKERLERTRGHT